MAFTLQVPRKPVKFAVEGDGMLQPIIVQPY